MEVDTLPYDDESGAKYSQEHPEHDFKSRIGAGRLYLLSESSAVTNGRLRRLRKEGDGTDEMAVEDEEPAGEVAGGIRNNAILFRGDPIANLPTQRIFAYVGYCGTPPLGLEWVNDTNVVLVWKMVSEARDAYRSMREAGTLEMEEDDEGFVPARPIPETLAPMEMRLEKALGKATQEQGQIWMRWARAEDVKERGGRNKSRFYEKYGDNAGKEGQNIYSSSRREDRKRKREDTDEELRRKLDAELDGFAEGEESTRRRSISPRRERSASPPRRDHDRKSGNRRRRHGDYDYDSDLKSRLGVPVGSSGRPIREWDIGKEWDTDEFGRSSFARHDREGAGENEGRGGRRDERGYRRDRRENGGRRREPREARAALTKEQLDAELDAFLDS